MLVFKLLSYFKPYKYKTILLIIIISIVSVLSIVPPWLIKIAIDNYIYIGQKNMFPIMIMIIVFLGLIEGILSFFRFYYRFFISNKIIQDIRNHLFTHVNQLSFSFHNKSRTGDLIARIISDTESLRLFLARSITNFIIETLVIIGVCVVIFLWNYQFGLFFLLLVPVIIFINLYYLKKIRLLAKDTRIANANITSSAQQILAGIKEIKLFGNEKYSEENFDKYSQKFLNLRIKENKLTAFWFPFIEFILTCYICLLLLFGSWLIINKMLTVGMIVGIITYVVKLSFPLKVISRFTGQLVKANTNCRRIFQILEIESDVKNLPGAYPLACVKGEIEFNNVNFTYSSTTPILNDINFKILPGQTAAFVGPSGVGKTTLLHLLPRFYDILSGDILIDGINIKNITLDSLRKNVGIVMQNTFLFNDTIENNLCFGKANASHRQIRKVAEAAQIADFIQSLPLDYQTPIGERGVRLSGGQAQRIALARVLLTDPKILILDEPTAQLDVITDRKLMKAVYQVMQGRTTLVIAHRLWTIKHADVIFVLKDGKIIAKGKHVDLVQKNNYYKEFFSTQFEIKRSQIESN